LERNLHGAVRKIAYGVATLAFAIVLTATYHLGYDHYRDEGVAQPETGNIAISLPTILTANPVGSIGAHVAMHLTAVTRSYETDTFLPPQVDVESSSSAQILRVDEAIALIRSTTTQARPILVPNAIPDGWVAEVRAEATTFEVTFSSPSGEKRLTLQISEISPAPGSTSGQVRPGFHGDSNSLYTIVDKNNPTGVRHLNWLEKGTWSARPELEGVPYQLIGTGLTDEEFWELANSLHPNQI
jgi:hypothetical protein